MGLFPGLYPNPQARRSDTRALSIGLGVPSIPIQEAVEEDSRYIMVVRVDHIPAEGEEEVNFERFVACANAASGLGQDSIGHWVWGEL